VQQVVDSAASARVAAYRQVHRQAASAEPAGPGMAVLVQVMVTAEAAGVAFTANPLTGDRHEVVITAVCGQNRRDDPSCGGAARRPPIGLPARPMGGIQRRDR
jgi:phosphoenolpyruvate synthase/pyruvate phosphate dikinase